jgi:hypothetical protein
MKPSPFYGRAGYSNSISADNAVAIIGIGLTTDHSIPALKAKWHKDTRHIST